MKRHIVIALTVLALSLGLLRAQTYQLNWSTVDGGGGPSAGGSFSLNSTIGQPDAGTPMSGGNFSISGGFWTVPSVGPQPSLAIRHGIGNTVILSWPNPSTGYLLQQTANMSGPGGGWADVTQTPVIVGPNQEVTLQATGRFCLFRLRRL